MTVRILPALDFTIFLTATPYVQDMEKLRKDLVTKFPDLRFMFSSRPWSGRRGRRLTWRGEILWAYSSWKIVVSIPSLREGTGRWTSQPISMHFCASFEEPAFAGQRLDAAAATTLADEIASLLTKLLAHFSIDLAISMAHLHVSN